MNMIVLDIILKSPRYILDLCEMDDEIWKIFTSWCRDNEPKLRKKN